MLIEPGVDPYRDILDPEGAVENAAGVIKVASPLLRELVNQATWALQRCHAASDKPVRGDEDLVPLTLFRHVIEFSDAIEVLVAQSCSVPVVPLLRSSKRACRLIALFAMIPTGERCAGLSGTPIAAFAPQIHEPAQVK